MVKKPVAITVGEPAGIGPDLCLDILSGDWTGNIVVIGDREVLAARARTLNMPFAVADYHVATVQHRAILHCPGGGGVWKIVGGECRACANSTQHCGGRMFAR